MRLTQKNTGIQRRLMRLQWSLKKRIIPTKEQIISFDCTLRMIVRPLDRLGKRIYLDGYSDRELAVLLDAYLKPGMVFFDVGAHFGQFTLMAAKRVGSKGRVHSFEPAQETFAQLIKNIKLNQFICVASNHCALYDDDRSVELNICINGMGEFNSIGTPLPVTSKVTSKESVDAMRLDTYCEKHKIERIDFMKIDVEGAEMKVLRGGQRTFSSENGPSLVVEFNENTSKAMGYSTKQLRRQLEILGYRLFRFDPDNLSLKPEPHMEIYDEMVNVIATKDPDIFVRQMQRNANQ